MICLSEAAKVDARMHQIKGHDLPRSIHKVPQDGTRYIPLAFCDLLNAAVDLISVSTLITCGRLLGLITLYVFRI